MTNFEKYKQNLTLNNVLYPDSACDYCVRGKAACNITNTEVCRRYLREYMEAEAD